MRGTDRIDFLYRRGSKEILINGALPDPRNVHAFGPQNVLAGSLRNLLFGEPGEIAGIIGLRSRAEILHSAAALHTLIAWLTPDEELSLLSVGNLVSDLSTGSLLILGNPATNAHARLILGVSGTSSPLTGFDLPVTFRLSDIGGTQKRNPLCVVVNGAPLVDARDYVVFTVIPVGVTDKIVVISTLQSIGTRALSLVMRDTKAVERLVEHVGSSSAWQACVRILKINWLTSLPQEIGEITVYPIDEAKLPSASQIRRRLVIDEGIWENLVQMSPNSPLNVADDQPRASLNPRYRHGTLAEDLLEESSEQGQTPNLNDQMTQGRLSSRSSGSPVQNVAGSPEAKVDRRETDSIEVSPRKRGRPPFRNREAVKLRRFAMKLAAEDIERAERLFQRGQFNSLAEVFRTALLEYEHLLDSADQEEKKVVARKKHPA